MCAAPNLILFLMFTESMVELGFKKVDVEKALHDRAYNELFGTYLLLGQKSSEVTVLQPLLSRAALSFTLLLNICSFNL